MEHYWELEKEIILLDYKHHKDHIIKLKIKLLNK